MIDLIKLLFIYLYTIFYISCISTVELLKEIKNDLKHVVISNKEIIKNKKRN